MGYYFTDQLQVSIINEYNHTGNNSQKSKLYTQALGHPKPLKFYSALFSIDLSYTKLSNYNYAKAL